MSDHKFCFYCGAARPIRTNDRYRCAHCTAEWHVGPQNSSVLIPVELLTDLVQVCHWLQLIGFAQQMPDLALLSFWTEQSRLVQAWAEEFLPTATEGNTHESNLN